MEGIERRARLARSRLYFALEARPGGNDPSALLEATLRGGVDVVQLRDKELPDDELVRAAEPFRRACAEHGALFVLNDRPELVERCGADGVHVGQVDASVADARRAVGPDRLVGLSASTREELETASAEADYLGVIVGAPTTPEGLDLVRAARDLVRVPWFATGGIELDTIDAVYAAGAAGAAVVRALRDAADPEEAARALRAALPPSGPIVCGPGRTRRALLPQVDVLEGTLAPGEDGARPHTHRMHTDIFYVVAGELEFRLGGETVRVPAGSCVTAPPHFVHGFRNPGTVEARYVNVHAPGVFGRRLGRGDPPEHFDTYSGVGGASPDARGTVNGPGDGDRLTKEHRLLLVKSAQPHADVFELFVGAEYGGTEPHLHLRHADCLYVLEGELELTAGSETIRAGAGTSVVIPPGVVHSVTSVDRARFLNVHAPSCSFAEYLRRVDAGDEVDDAQYDSYDV